MGFLKKLFSRPPEKYLADGDRLMESQRWYDARCEYEKGLEEFCRDSGSARQDLAPVFHGRIASANRSLAFLNIEEAGYARSRGDDAKAREHLELALSLTDDPAVRQKAEGIRAGLNEVSGDEAVIEPASSCGGCGGGTHHGSTDGVNSEIAVADMPPGEYYELLIHQLPPDMCSRYAGLGENFAGMYIAGSENRHDEALAMLESWFTGEDRDIYCYEKGMLLFRSGRKQQAERWLRESVTIEPRNSLAHLGLALFLMDVGDMGEAVRQVDGMIEQGILRSQALMLRGEIHAHLGEFDQAIELYSTLLNTPASKHAAQSLHDVLMHCGRTDDAKHVRKRYLTGCSH